MATLPSECLAYRSGLDEYDVAMLADMANRLLRSRGGRRHYRTARSRKWLTQHLGRRRCSRPALRRDAGRIGALVHYAHEAVIAEALAAPATDVSASRCNNASVPPYT